MDPRLSTLGPPGLRAWTSNGAWTALGALRVLELFGLTVLIAAVGVLVLAIYRFERRKRGGGRPPLRPQTH